MIQGKVFFFLDSTLSSIVPCRVSEWHVAQLASFSDYERRGSSLYVGRVGLKGVTEGQSQGLGVLCVESVPFMGVLLVR